MKRNVKMVLILVVMIAGFLPHRVSAVGEYDGHWVGSEKVSVEGETETITSDTIIFQQDADNLIFAETFFGPIHFVRSGNDWIIPSPIYGELLGYDVVVDSMKLTFTSQTAFTGSANVSVDVDGETVSGSATLSFSKQTCAQLSNGVPVLNLSGAEDSFQCFQIDLPEATPGLTVTTSGGSGDCDLGVVYHQPNVFMESSEGDYTDEEIDVSSPASGRWYVILYGYEDYSGVTLIARHEAGTGVPPGLISFDVGPDEQVRLDLNITNSRGDVYSDIKAEWLVLTATMGGAQLPILVLTSGGQIYDVAAVSDFNAVTYSFNHGSDVATIANLALGSLGFKAGDTLVYGYAYTTSDVSKVVLDNIVTLNVK